MARLPIAFSDGQLEDIRTALQRLSARYPDNRAFLSRAFDEIDRIAGRSFGETIYRRLLVQAGIDRSPSTRTVQSVLAQRRAAAGPDGTARLTGEGPLAPVRSEVGRALPDDTVFPVVIEGSVRWLTEHCERLEAQVRELQMEQRTFIERAAALQAQADCLAAQLEQGGAVAFAREQELLSRLGRTSDELVTLAERLEAADRRRAIETDAIRQSLREERERLILRIQTLERELDAARTSADNYRRGAGGRPGWVSRSTGEVTSTRTHE